MTVGPNLKKITDLAVKDISSRVAKLEMQNTGADQIHFKESKSLVLTTKGAYKLTVVFQADPRVMDTITKHMKRDDGYCAPEEIVEYTTEFFNILGGHVVTVLNNQMHVSARFEIPKAVENGYLDERIKNAKNKQELCYQSEYGFVVVQTYQEISQ